MRLTQWISGFSRRRFYRNCHDLHRFENAKRILLNSDELTDQEKILLQNVSLLVHRHDDMFHENGEKHYLAVGLGVIRCLETAVQISGKDKNIHSVLDFPCGYGRELRFLKHRFPDTDIYISEIIPEALNFCRNIFSVKALTSNTDFTHLEFPEKFDLIWCGSLITHKDEEAIKNLLKVFHDHLMPDGLCVFTTAGQTVVEFIKTRKFSYDLPEHKLEKVLAQFNERGFGYVDYDNFTDYGISLTSYDCMTGLAQNAGNWQQTFFLEHGWDNHQDVYAYKKPA